MKPVHFETVLDVKAPISQAWEVISNTDKLNRSLGLPPVTYTPLRDGSVLLKAEMKQFGLRMTWDEYPFDWIEEKFFCVERHFHSSPVRILKLCLEFVPQAAGSKLRVTAEATPRRFFWRPLLRLLIGKKIRSDFGKVVRQLNKFAVKEEERPLPKTKTGTVSGEVLSKRLQGVVEEFPQYRDWAERLDKLIHDGFDNEILAIRPFELADQWELPRRDFLIFMLHATRAGVFDLRWSVLCPVCRVPKARYETLSKVKPTVHCDTCQLDYDAEFDRSVEARFDVNPAIRRAKNENYCIGGPGNTPHVYAQFFLNRGETREVKVPLPARRWKVHSWTGAMEDLSVEKNSAAAAVDVDLKDGGAVVSPVTTGAGEVLFRFRNRSSGETMVRLEEESWKERAATAAYVTALPQFRDLFSSEVLSPGEEIAVRNLAVMFTDLKGSTSFYQQSGDAKAYQLVRDHFGFLTGILERHNGFLVKTIGDAILAVYFSPLEAVRAALDIQREIGRFNAEKKANFTLKLGIHNGPLIAVNANGQNDYFGSTMNIGARLEKESHGGDVVITEAVANDPEVKQFLAANPVKQESLTARLKGIEKDFRLLRLKP